MTDAPAALLQAVLDAPDDDTPRLAYAAWSEAQGDEASIARAELIRTQIELARMDSELVRTGRAYVTQQRVRQLVDRYGRTWAGPMAEWVERFSFLRGFIEWVRLSARSFLDHGERIVSLAPVRHVDLTAVRDVDESLFDSPLLARLRSLAMDACGLYDLHLQLLAASPYVTRLRWLSVAENHLTLAAAEAVAASPNLRDLQFAELRANPGNPVERVGYDSGVVIATSMPPEGAALEARYGPLPWLHRDVMVDRFGTG